MWKIIENLDNSKASYFMTVLKETRIWRSDEEKLKLVKLCNVSKEVEIKTCK